MVPEKVFRKAFENHKICVIIPTYNNADSIEEVIRGVQKFTSNVIVVNDGSTDTSLKILSGITDIDVIGYDENVGKGFAIRKGFKHALEQGFDYAITIDSDGQHDPDDLSLFVQKLEETGEALIVGARNIRADGMPAKNTFANKFSNFWFWAETGIRLPDTQSGFRLYPIKKYRKTRFFTKKYEFEIEVLVRSEWSRIPIKSIPVSVYYPPEDERVSHFRPLPDFSRISVLNTVLVLITLLWIWPLKLFRYFADHRLIDIVKEQISMHNENRLKTAAGLGFGVFMGILPIWGFQMLTAAFLAHIFRLNKVLVLLASNISIPPLVPFIIYFSFETGAMFMSEPAVINSETVSQLKSQVMTGNFYAALQDLGYSIYQYVMGSIVLGALLGALTFFVSYLILTIYTKAKLTGQPGN